MASSSFRSVAFFLLFATVFMLAAQPSRAQSDAELDALYTRVRDLYRAGMYGEAMPVAEQYVAATKSRFGDAHQRTAIAIGWMADIYEAQGRYAAAEPLYKLSLAIKEKVVGPQDSSVAITLNNLAILYKLQGRNPEAEAHYKRSLAIWEKAVGPDHDSVGNVLANLATLYSDQRRFAEAETLYKRALAIREKALGREHPNVGSVVNNLAHTYREQGRLTEAEPLYRRALAIAEKSYGSDHPRLGARLNNLGAIYQSQGRFAEAEPLYKRGLTISERALGSNHPDVALQLWNLALLAAERGDAGVALAYQRRATAIRIKRGETGRDKEESGGRELIQGTNYFRVHVFIADRAGGDRSALLQETFEMAQWALQTRAADALAQMSARFVAGAGGLAGAVRERQDLERDWRAADGRLNTATSAADAARAEAARNEIAALEAKLALLDQRLAKEFPDYFQLATPKPLDIAGVQAALKADEVLVTFLDVPAYYKLPETMFAWVVTKTTASWRKLPVTPSWVAESVAVLRCGLDQSAWNQETGSGKCKTALNVPPREEIIKIADKDARVQVLPFDVARAHELYKALLGPIDDLIGGKHLIVVPSGPLTSLPFNVLVTERPKTAIPGNLGEYRDAAWLGARQPITTLPSVTSLKALRQFAKASRATKPYLGVGNPLLDGPQDDPRSATHYKKQAQAARDRQTCPKTITERIVLAARPLANFTTLFRGTHADIEEVRYWTPLPESADELCEIRRRLGVAESDILLGNRATEATLKGLSERGGLADYGILHFATHGALTGQVQGSAEPGLILTPPRKGTTDSKALDRDDGFLTASEIATLKLDANWVILSACNTAGGAGENAEALSGMARAFFYAGARALLVSHWEVGSDAAVKLTTRAFAELKAKPAIGRAEALRVSMRELIAAGSLADAHPAMWAPFVVVGEGAN